MADRLLRTIEQFSFYAIETAPGLFPAHEFVESLDDIGKRDFLVAARILATTIATGRPPAGRSERIRSSSTGLYELRITPRGRRGPHARLLYIRDGNAIRCARGVLKRERLARRDIQLADHDIRTSPNQP
jgi:hypothetical protein